MWGRGCLEMTTWTEKGIFSFFGGIAGAILLVWRHASDRSGYRSGCRWWALRPYDQSWQTREPRCFAAFRALLHATAARVQRRVLASCLMLHHVHLALWCQADGDLRRVRPWLLSAPVRRSPRHYQVQRPCLAGALHGVSDPIRISRG